MILQRKNDFTEKRWFYKEKIILPRKDDFAKKRLFCKEKMILQKKKTKMIEKSKRTN